MKRESFSTDMGQRYLVVAFLYSYRVKCLYLYENGNI